MRIGVVIVLAGLVGCAPELPPPRPDGAPAPDAAAAPDATPDATPDAAAAPDAAPAPDADPCTSGIHQDPHAQESE